MNSSISSQKTPQYKKWEKKKNSLKSFDPKPVSYTHLYNLSVMIAWLHTITANIYPELGTSRNATGRHLYLLEHFTLKKSS